MAGNRKAKYDVAPVVRSAFLAALKHYHKKTGKTLSEAMADWLEEDPLNTLRAVSRFTVREHQHSGEVASTHRIDLTALSPVELQTLEALLGKATVPDRSSSGTSPARPDSVH